MIYILKILSLEINAQQFAIAALEIGWRKFCEQGMRRTKALLRKSAGAQFTRILKMQEESEMD